MVFSEAGEEFGGLAFGADGGCAETVEPKGTDWGTRGELGIADFVSG